MIKFNKIVNIILAKFGLTTIKKYKEVEDSLSKERKSKLDVLMDNENLSKSNNELEKFKSEILMNYKNLFRINKNVNKFYKEVEDLLLKEQKSKSLVVENYNSLETKYKELIFKNKNYDNKLEDLDINSFEKDIYNILENNLELKLNIKKYFISCNYNYYIVLKFPYISESDYLDSNGNNKFEIQDKIFREYLKSFRERLGKNKITGKYDTNINYVWTRELGKVKQTHYNVLIYLSNKLYIRDNFNENEYKKWEDLLIKYNLHKNGGYLQPKWVYFKKITGDPYFLTSSNKSYIFKEFAEKKRDIEKNILFVGFDSQTRYFILNNESKRVK